MAAIGFFPAVARIRGKISRLSPFSHWLPPGNNNRSKYSGSIFCRLVCGVTRSPLREVTGRPLSENVSMAKSLSVFKQAMVRATSWSANPSNTNTAHVLFFILQVLQQRKDAVVTTLCQQVP